MQTSCMDAMRHKVECGGRLKAAFEALDLTQKEVAEEFGITSPQINHWVSGRHYPPPLFLAWLGGRHGITADWIYREHLVGLPKSLADSLAAAKRASLLALPAPAPPARGKRNKSSKPSPRDR